MNICIVGAGIFGMAAALELRNRGHEITLIERGQIPNPEASSTDVSKVIRRTNYPNETYVELVTRAAAQWQAWHNRTSRSIYFQHGALIVSRDLEADHETHAGWETLNRLGKDVYELTAGEVRERFPQFTVSDEDSLFFDPWAGYLRSGRALEDLAKLASEAGVTILENTLVTAVEETPAGARVRTESEWKDCDRAVVSAGPWVSELVPEMKKRVRITRQQMAFFAPEDPGPFERTRFPVWMIFSPGNLWYGFPYLHEGFVKVAEDSKWDDAEVDVSREPTDEFLAWALRVRCAAHTRPERCAFGRRPVLSVYQYGQYGGRGIRHRLGPGLRAGADRGLRLRPWLQIRRRHRARHRGCGGRPGEPAGRSVQDWKPLRLRKAFPWH